MCISDREQMEKAGMPPKAIEEVLKALRVGVGTVDSFIGLWRALKNVDLSPLEKVDNAENTNEN